MRVAIMQPYLFPYIGYFQLMNAVDLFVFGDDVQYIKGGWINRNRILLQKQVAWLTVPVGYAPRNATIAQRDYQFDEETRSGLESRIRAAYQKAPHFDEVFPEIQRILAYQDANVARFNEYQLREIGDLLGIKCRYMSASALAIDPAVRCQDRVLAMCRELGATEYINPIGGLELYHDEVFKQAGFALSFTKAKPTDYPQFEEPHVPFLSIIDVLMFNGFKGAADLLPAYERVTKDLVLA